MKNLLEVITKDLTLPEGYDSWGIKSVHKDRSTTHNYTWPAPGNATPRQELDISNRSACPARLGDGLCVALDWNGMASGGINAKYLLVVAYRSAEMQSDSIHKLRTPEVFVVAEVDGYAFIRENGAGASLYGADLNGANLVGANLVEANLGRGYLEEASLYGANLEGADLARAILRGANLRGANLVGADLRRGGIL